MAHHDLREAHVLYEMLLDPWAWRDRSIQTVILNHAHHVEVVHRYQVHLKSDGLPFEADVHPLDHVQLLLPLATRWKQPLLNFQLNGPASASASLLTRREISQLQQGLIYYMLEDSPLATQLGDQWGKTLLEAIFSFTPAIYSHYLENGGASAKLRGGGRLAAFDRYLSHLGGLSMTNEQLERCLDIHENIRPILSDALAEPPADFSAAEKPLLAVPMMGEDTPGEGQDVVALLEKYLDGIYLADKEGLRGVLAVLAEYGRRWQVIVDTTLQIDRRDSVGTTEHAPFISVRPHHASRRVRFHRYDLSHRIELLDAPSIHAEVQTADHRVDLKGYRVVSPEGRNLGFPFWESVRHTPEFLSLYTSRVYEYEPWARLQVRLRPVAHVRWPSRFILLLTLGAVVGGVAATFPSPGRMISIFALLTFPTTFAVALLLLREGSGLSARLQLRMRLVITFLVALLWLTVFIRIAKIL